MVDEFDGNSNGQAEMESCELCGGECEASEITVPVFDPEDRIVLIEHVPAVVCLDCGEAYVDDDVDEVLESVDWSESEPARFEQVPVYDYGSV